MSDEEQIREQLACQNAVLGALIASLEAQEARRKAMHQAHQKPRGGYR